MKNDRPINNQSALPVSHVQHEGMTFLQYAAVQVAGHLAMRMTNRTGGTDNSAKIASRSIALAKELCRQLERER